MGKMATNQLFKMAASKSKSSIFETVVYLMCEWNQLMKQGNNTYEQYWLLGEC